MSVSEGFHPDDIEAHLVIKRLCGLPPERKLTNQQAVTKLFARLARESRDDISDADEAILHRFVLGVSK